MKKLIVKQTGKKILVPNYGFQSRKYSFGERAVISQFSAAVQLLCLWKRDVCARCQFANCKNRRIKTKISKNKTQLIVKQNEETHETRRLLQKELSAFCNSASFGQKPTAQSSNTNFVMKIFQKPKNQAFV